MSAKNSKKGVGRRPMHAWWNVGRKGAARFAFVVALLVSSGPVLAAEGVLLAVWGNVSVQYYGADRPAEIGLRLRPGDIVRSLGGEASGMLEDGRMFRLGQDEEYTVPGDRATGPAGVLASRLMGTIREMVSRGRASTGEGIAPDEGGIRLLYPHNAFVLPEDLKFEWRPVEGVDLMEITVKSPSPIYSQTFMASAGESGAFFPGDAPPLVPGVRYFWWIREVGAGTREPVTSEVAWFTVLEPGRFEDMQGYSSAIDAMDFLGESERDILHAGLLISYGLHHRAEGLLRKGLERFPGDQGMKHLLGGLYMEMKMPEAAKDVLEPRS